jgi:alkanesulfonate monooxygenase SsuD/methylene tetrahydromethanopterin reductase-like flavin-dependent oxidoreductase (luciferase family)
MTIELGLFDIHQVDPTDDDSIARGFERRLDLLALADRAGLRYAFTAERHYLPAYRTPAPTAWIAAASQRTSSLRLGVLAYTLPLHLPAALAEEVAILDHLSNGRLEIGFGLGHRPEELAAIGLDPGEREQLFQERYAVMTALWEGASVTLERPGTLVRNVAIHPLPLQKPYPPLWFAGSDLQAARWAGGRGMSLAIGFKRTPELQPAVEAFRAGHARLGESLLGAGRIALMRHVSIAPTDAEAVDAMSEDLDRLQQLGSGEPSDIDRAREMAYHMILDESFIVGSPETVANAIQLARTHLGIDVFLANIHAAGVNDERLRQMVRLLAEEVAPRLRD